ncbi:fatty-acid--CoA ligase [Camelimonas fluminis]|uniref:Long-chain-fatty-acid--CoA ligase n=1 Tax=Camelimonas fluminis TaxID=1576911 RepID=A0ABV7UN34_9HYPH|nr:long-chain-fatty-acid--CoA ligase [Camelimonas fluminis]GHE61002.1 fatty-acid--CoA ligase [Camelimonas fluminis]
MNTTLGLRKFLDDNPQGIATIFGDRQRTWAEIGDRVQRFAGALHGLGVKHDDRVAVMSQNNDKYFEIYLAVAWAGAVVVPLNVRWSQAENEDALRDCRASLLLADDAFAVMAQSLSAAIGNLPLVYMGEQSAPEGFADYEQLIANATPVDDAMRQGADLAGIFYTGGTTGRSKGVMLSHHNLMLNAVNSLSANLMGQGSRYIHVAPMFHLGNGGVMYANMLLGGSNVMLPVFTPGAVAAAIDRHRVTHMMLVPTMIQMLVDSPDIDGYDLSSLEQIIYGASPISEALLDRAMQRLPGVRFVQAYGMTELSPMATLLRPEDHLGENRAKGRHRSAGRTVATCELRIVDENNNPLPRGEVGEIIVRGDTVMMGYWERPVETAAAIVDGWMHTGDGGYMDADGYVYVVDRIKDMIISGGENVYSVEVENVLAQHPAVAQCAVIGIPSERWGEQVHAVVVLRPGAEASPEDLMAFCRDRIAGYKCPRSVDLSAEPLPLSGAGKILKRTLRQRYLDAA